MASPPAPGQGPDRPLLLGVSACLLGQNVRYDGGHKRDRWITDELSRFVRFVPVCPEMEAGLGVPREAMRLAGDPAEPRLMTGRTGRDLTEVMRSWAVARVEELAGLKLCGFIFKSRSPSSGMARVKVYPLAGGMGTNTGVGIFARAFMERFPLLPVEEEGRLNDPGLRENFIERLFAMGRWRDILDRECMPGACTLGALVDFHTRHKLILMAHSPATCAGWAPWWPGPRPWPRRPSIRSTRNCSWKPWPSWPPRPRTPTRSSTWPGISAAWSRTGSAPNWPR